MDENRLSACARVAQGVEPSSCMFQPHTRFGGQALSVMAMVFLLIGCATAEERAVDPVAPDTAATATDPAVPVPVPVPATPETPETPETSAAPENAGTAETPASTTTPVATETPVPPEPPATARTPAAPEITATAAIPSAVPPRVDVDGALLAGDLVRIEVYDNPDLTLELRVPAEGPVQFPLIGAIDSIHGQTCESLAKLIEVRLSEYLTRASVTVIVKEYGPRSVFAMGGVVRPGAIMVEPSMPTTAMRAITAAGGLSEDADRLGITVLRRNREGVTEGLKVAADVGGDFIDVPLKPNDLIMVPRLARVFVSGEVHKPGSVPVSSQLDLTISRAISVAGGFDKYARRNKVQLLRSGEAVREVDVDAILDGRSEDLRLRPGDMIHVPQSRF